MKTIWFLLLLLTACQKGVKFASVEEYIRQHPRTLVVVAEAMLRGEIIIDMTPQEVEVLLGTPIGVYSHLEKGFKKKVLTYASDCQFRSSSEVQNFQGPVAIEFIEFPLTSEDKEWRLVNAWPVLR